MFNWSNSFCEHIIIALLRSQLGSVKSYAPCLLSPEIKSIKLIDYYLFCTNFSIWSKMSSRVTVTRSVTTNNTSVVFLNIGYLKSCSGILKLLQLVLTPMKQITIPFLVNFLCHFNSCDYLDSKCSGDWNPIELFKWFTWLWYISAGIVFGIDGGVFFHLHILPIAFVHFLAEHWRINFQNSIRKYPRTEYFVLHEKPLIIQS